MKEVSLEKLKGHIIRPGIERHLAKLCEFRGKRLGQVHRMWNYSISMMLHEATLADATQRLGCNDKYSQLCMPEKRPQGLQIGVFVGALKAMPEVANAEPHLLEYLLSVSKWAFDPRITRKLGPRSREWRAYDTNNPYPFLVHEGGRPTDPIVALITKAVPAWLDREMRADLCQDLAIAILSGDLDPSYVLEGIKAYLPKLWKVAPNSRWGDLSLNAPIPGRDDGSTLMDMMTGNAVESF